MSTMRPTSVPARFVGRFAVLLAACLLSSSGAFAQNGYGISDDFEEPPIVRTRVMTRARRPSRSPRARPGASSLLACLSPTHLFGSPADRLTRPCPPAHAPDLVAVPPQGQRERRHGADRVRLRVQALARGEGTSANPSRSNRTERRPSVDRDSTPRRRLTPLSSPFEKTSVASRPRTSSTRWSWCTLATARAGA